MKSDSNILDNIASKQKLDKLLGEAWHKADDGELYVESSQSESFVFDDNRLKKTSFNSDKGFGLRIVSNEAVGYAYSNDLSDKSLKSAIDAVKTIKNGYEGTLDLTSKVNGNESLYISQNPIESLDFDKKIKLLEDINQYVRSKDSKISQVSISLLSDWQQIEILRADGNLIKDIRPLVRVNISVVAKESDRQEEGFFGWGGRDLYESFIEEKTWKENADKAIELALTNLNSVPAPAGEMDIVLGSGWPGILLHEAIGHGLEGDAIRKKTSAFAELLNKKIASSDVTVVDDGTIEKRRGSLNFDDEGTATNCTTLIENGKLVNFMQDRLNARLMGVKPTGNGRRQSYAYQPIPRMTNTYMLNSDKSKDEILSSLKNGLYAVSFGGGQVDTTSGKFVFSCSEAYKVRNGKICEPVKGATIIGDGPTALTNIKMVGNDLSLDDGIGTCGKMGQGVPVGVGQPSLYITGLTVGGTDTA